MSEIWKDVVGYEGLYEVSNLGRVKRIEEKILTKKGVYRKVSERILKQNNLNGYLKVALCKNGIAKTQIVHILVANAFLDNNKNNGKVVDHINNIKSDNRLENLQIISQRENCSKDAKNMYSDYTGVTWHKKDEKWQASIGVDGNQVYLGQFDDKSRASIAYQFALRQLDSIKEIML
jgi:hypothetical protein